MKPRNMSFMAFVISGFLALPAFGGGVITDGDAIYEFIDSETAGLCNFLPDGAGGSDHMYQNWWWTWAGEMRPLTPTTEEYSGNTAAFYGVAGGYIEWDLRVELTDGDAPGEAVLSETLTTRNVIQQPRAYYFYAYSDIDAGGTYPDDTAELTDNGMLVTDPATGAYAEIAYDYEVTMVDVDYEAYQVAESPYLLDLLNGDEAVTLNDSGLPFGPGDFTAAYQWNKTYIPIYDFGYYYRTTTLGVPEPGTVALLAVGVLAALRRRR